MRWSWTLLFSAALLGLPDASAAQTAPASAQPAAAAVRPPRLLTEGAAGLARFVDDAPIEFASVGGGLRVFAADRIAIGPELVYMTGPDGASQWHLTGNLTFDLVPDGPRGGRRPRVVPYLVAAGGYQRMTTRVGTGRFTSSEGSVSGGGGARIAIGQLLYVAPEVRLGWEPHVRFGATIGARF
jgi:hypothetical protein